LNRTLKLVNHYSEFILSHPSRAPPRPFTLPEEIEIIRLGTEEILMTNITMSSFEIQSSEEVMNTQLGGETKTMWLGEGKRTMQLGDQTVMAQEEKGLSGAKWIIKDTEMSKMMLEAIWYRTDCQDVSAGPG